MNRRVGLFVITSVLVISGCQQGTSDDQTASNDSANSVLSDPAAQITSAYLDAVTRGDTERAIQLYTPLAAERMKQFPLPGIADYSFRVTGVDHSAQDRAIVECQGTRVSPSGERATEDICCLLERLAVGWRISGMVFHPDRTKPPVVLDFQNPDRGAIPIQQWLAETGPPAGESRPSPPQTAQESAPAGGYR
jgi:hypothetical protein